MKNCLFTLAACCLVLFGTAQDSAKNELKILLKNRVFFASPDPVELELVSDFKKVKSKRLKKVYQPATATLRLPQTEPITGEIQLAARGEFRRSICNMPSLMLNFKGTPATKLSPLKKMKLVCGCSATQFDEELLLREFLVYKIYNLLTDMSFGVRLAKLTYKDVADKTKPYTQYGFLIEDVDELAKRTGCKEYTGPVANSLATERVQMRLVSMFQYMIGNTDWSLPNRHNVRFVQLSTDSLSLPYIIPYDFDYCGLVNAPYAIPQQEFGIEKVTDRYYRGFACSKEELDPLINRFREKREYITALINNFTLLKQRSRDEMIRFINSFYEDLNDGRKLKYVFEKAVDHN